MRRLIATAGLALASLAVATAPLTSHATGTTGADDGQDDAVGRMMLVLDASGSMAEQAAGGRTKIDAAKSALTTVVETLPDDQPVGLRVYGATVFSADEPGACTDSQRVVDVGTDNRDDLLAAVDDYEPYGETPIGHALQEAGEDLGAEGQRSIVLVSDGEPTCDPDPCVVAERLSADGIDLRIDVVGLDVDGAAREALRCIAEAGNGTYYDADGADGLVESLTVAQTRASRPFDLTGTPVEGTPDPADAPELTAPGQYLDTVPVSGTLSYRIPRTEPGSTIHVGVALKGTPGSAGDSLFLTVHPASDPQGLRCNGATAYGVGLGSTDPLIYGGTSSWQADPEQPCTTDDAVIATIEPGVGEIGGGPIEIAVYEEPPLQDPTGRGLDPAPAEPRWTPLEPAAQVVDAVVPGSSISNAPVVDDGTYRLDINPGETQVVAVPLDWGQHVQAQLDATLTPAVADAAAVGSSIDVEVMGPLRTEDGVRFPGGVPRDWSTTALGNEPAGSDWRTGAQSFTVGYLNRGSNDPDQSGVALPGLRYVTVHHRVLGDDANLSYLLTIRRAGSPGDGDPDYATGALTAPAADSALVSRVVSGADDGEETGESQGAAESSPDEDAEAQPSGDGADESGVPWLPIGLGVAGLLVLAQVVALLVARRAGTERAATRPGGPDRAR